MKNLFISQPMKGKTKEEILSERERAIAAAKQRFNEDEIVVLDTYITEEPPEDSNQALWYLAKSLSFLANADIAYFVKGWDDARGCIIEHDCAVEYEIETIEEGLTEDDGRMSFGIALSLMMEGLRMTRAGWNGKGMSVVYQKGYPEGIPCNKQTAEAWGMKEGELFKCDPYLQISTVDGSHAMWVPSIRDCLADDWEIVWPQEAIADIGPQHEV